MKKPLVVCALLDEVRPFQSKMDMDGSIHFKPAILYQGKFLNKEVDLLISGVGAKYCEMALEKAFKIKIPSYILMVGYAGGASPLAGLGCTVLAQTVLDEKGREKFDADPALFETAKKLCEAQNLSYQTGRMVTVDRVVSLPHEKANIGVTHRSIAIDMESALVGKAAKINNIPFLVVKSILDPLDMQLPDFQDGAEDGWLGHFIKTPKDILKIPSISYNAHQARTSINKFLEGWFQQNPQP